METYPNNLTANSQAMGKTVTRIGNASAEAHHTIDKVSEATGPAVDSVTTGAHQVVDKLAGVATNAAETIGAKSEQLKLAQNRMTGTARDYVRENPLTSVGIAVAGGVLLGRLFNSR